MKRYIILIIILFLSIFVKIPRYIELNDLKIIESINCDKDYYYLKEIIPIRNNNGIEYEKKIHKVKDIDDKYFIKYAVNNCIYKKNR